MLRHLQRNSNKALYQWLLYEIRFCQPGFVRNFYQLINVCPFMKLYLFGFIRCNSLTIISYQCFMKSPPDDSGDWWAIESSRIKHFAAEEFQCCRPPNFAIYLESVDLRRLYMYFSVVMTVDQVSISSLYWSGGSPDFQRPGSRWRIFALTDRNQVVFSSARTAREIPLLHEARSRMGKIQGDKSTQW